MTFVSAAWLLFATSCFLVPALLLITTEEKTQQVKEL
jgi:hypothetical protein